MLAPRVFVLSQMKIELTTAHLAKSHKLGLIWLRLLLRRQEGWHWRVRVR